MTQTAGKVMDEIGRPVEILADLVSDHKDQIRDVVVDIGHRAQDLPKTASHVSNRSARRGVRTPIVAALVLIVTAALAWSLAGRKHNSDDQTAASS